jgi:phosphatidylethanolamine/phosphatidyl-N-methylethanolamine N-methyltransferase
VAASALDNASVASAYARWAPVYDLVFTTTMAPGRRAAVAAAEAAGAHILDVGVGTGLELPMFAPTSRVVGVDLSEPMLKRARERVLRERLSSVEGLSAMDATRLAFADATFDVAVAPYVMSVVPDPAATLDEMARVVKPGGAIVLVNHFGAEEGWLAAAEGFLARHGSRLGWHPQFPWATVGDWVAATPRATLKERRKLAPLGLFTLAVIGLA